MRRKEEECYITIMIRRLESETRVNRELQGNLKTSSRSQLDSSPQNKKLIYKYHIFFLCVGPWEHYLQTEPKRNNRVAHKKSMALINDLRTCWTEPPVISVYRESTHTRLTPPAPFPCCCSTVFSSCFPKRATVRSLLS